MTFKTEFHEQRYTKKAIFDVKKISRFRRESNRDLQIATLARFPINSVITVYSTKIIFTVQKDLSLLVNFQ